MLPLGGVVYSENGRFRMTLGTILMFMTGTNAIPPLGFDEIPVIEFDLERNLPRSSTCSLKIFLPGAANKEEFKKNITRGVFESVGYGFP